VPKYDAHVAYVAEKAPCPPKRLERAYSELVLFENAAILPRFILSLDVLETTESEAEEKRVQDQRQAKRKAHQLGRDRLDTLDSKEKATNQVPIYAPVPGSAKTLLAADQRRIADEQASRQLAERLEAEVVEILETSRALSEAELERQRKQADAQKQARDQEARRKMVKGADRLRCPGCRCEFAKDGRCNHITCPCGTHYCRECNCVVAATRPYDHFNAGGQTARDPPCKLFLCQ
jgi:hypothetical protein